MTNPSHSLDQLIAAAHGGDRPALEAVLLHFHDPLLGYLRKALRRHATSWITPEDVLQDTLIEASRGIRTLELRGTDAFFAWLRTIARTRMINQIKAARAQKRGGARHGVSNAARDDTAATSILNLLASADPTASRIAQRREALEAMGKALDALDPAKRRILDLRYVQNLPVEDVAHRTGKSPSAVKMIIHRAIQELRQSMAASGDFTAGV